MEIFCGTCLTTIRYVSFLNTTIAYSLTRHTLHWERKSLVTLQSSRFFSRQKLALTNEINTLHLLLTVMELQLCHNVFSGWQHLMALFDSCIPRWQLISCSVTGPSLCEGCGLQDYSACRSVELPFYVVFMTSSFTTVSEQIVMYIAVYLQYAEFTSVV